MCQAGPTGAGGAPRAALGKTALLGYAATAPDFPVARAEGVESEMELPSRHCISLRPDAESQQLAAGPQRDALGVAFGLRSGTAPDRFLVGLAVLTLMRRGRRPAALVPDR